MACIPAVFPIGMTACVCAIEIIEKRFLSVTNREITLNRAIYIYRATANETVQKSPKICNAIDRMQSLDTPAHGIQQCRLLLRLSVIRYQWVCVWIELCIADRHINCAALMDS